MKEIIWFFGSSAAGKQTLIEKILREPESYTNKFNFNTDTMVCCKESIDWTTTETQNKRQELIDVIEDYTGQTLLMKGQTVDLIHDLLPKIKNKYPNLEQRIVFVFTEPTEELERWKKHREWYHPSMTEQTIIEEIKEQLKYLKTLQNNHMRIISVNGGSNANYEILKFPPDGY